MDIKEALARIEKFAADAMNAANKTYKSVNDGLERADAKTDAAVKHLVSSKRTLGWILLIVLADFIAGLWVGGKLF